ncbi:methylated-DNA--[protein]-cysteine S-methyltransferase [Sphingomonas sp. ABOLD]|uniref:Methylated-DNA-[protein]-cysteine S-methyltransferase n=1 Tax=Sphingomonas trueperi TaxID=53317 RepID=A0A7X5XVK1_9SPHN|nr:MULTISPECIES: methylated-DNA--[protein]-cysteine S-methyltransferase [Sphingomonas]NJB96158.1 methylated-DNA-[protein]-cysteine S-methyltransferase [Sphingomonas trueperi]RSV44922.1 methylated-DNA--[protein]-cysteine S-methyltransferase [Sphingomonas sp. ABOLE]RSV51117.1 methylated-DNA--[protein]-cysteine S-methyltransferase [Sphingomonas sp. ABOLD]
MYARDHALIATPIGPIRIEGKEGYLERITIGVEGPASHGSAAAVRAAAEQLEQWFAGERRDFDVALAPASTPRGAFLRDGLIAVPFGKVISYGELSRALGSSARAIGQLCARNPFPLVVPCHRVVNQGGGLGAYSAGQGPITKSWLLEHERRLTGDYLL